MILNYIKNILHLYVKPHRLNQFHSNSFIYFKAMKLKTFFNSPFSQNPSKRKPCDYFQNTECTEIILAHTLVHLLDCQVLGAITAMWLPASVEELLEEEGSNWLYLVIRQLAQTWGKGQKACVSQIMLPPRLSFDCRRQHYRTAHIRELSLGDSCHNYHTLSWYAASTLMSWSQNIAFISPFLAAFCWWGLCTVKTVLTSGAMKWEFWAKSSQK